MQSSQAGIGQRMASALKRLLMTVFVLALIGLVAWLASERNARTFSLAEQNGSLVVMKGRMFPWGAEPWSPSDPGLASTYAPIPLEGASVDPSVTQTRYSDRDELDRALFGVLDRLARPRVGSEDPKEVQRGLDYVRRMKALSGLTQDQRASLDRLESEYALFVARSRLNEAWQLISDALDQLNIASRGTGANARRANQMAAEVAGPAKQLEEALRRAVGSAADLQPEAMPEPQAPAPQGPTTQPEPTAQQPIPQPTTPAPEQAEPAVPPAANSDAGS